VGAWKDSIFIWYGVLTNSLLERAFSAAVADNQYAALGLMLLGTLARLRKVLGVEIESQFQAAVEGEEGAKLASETLGADSRKRLGEGVGRDVDIGVVLRREELRREAKSTEEVVIDTRIGDTKRPNVLESNTDSLMPDSGTLASTSALAIKPQKKRKRKKGDEFDELFSSLI
jgi:ribonuclease MRP protein subunit RMP1